MEKTLNRYSGWHNLLLVIFLVSLFQLAYQIPNRTDIWAIWLRLGLAFTSYFIILFKFNKDEFVFSNNLLLIFSRLLILFSFPLLSDDIYRFIWDGSLMHHGINPFSITPNQLMQLNPQWIDSTLFTNMNSQAYYSVYPPINQFAFYLSAIPGKGNLLASAIILRIFILAFDFGNIYLIKKLLQFYKKDKKLIYLYALNPLVIVEFTGNLHFEAVMIFFTLLAIWFLTQNKWIWAAIALSLAINAKLLPLIFFPLFIHHIGLKKSVYAGFIIVICTLLLFAPFLYKLNYLENFISSLQLYYGKFEFNGSIYQLLKKAGWEILNYNPILYTSKILLLLTLIGFLIAYIKSKNIIEGIFWVMFTYTLCGAIVHPWYMLILVAFTPFLKYRFALVWSVLICLSYYTYRVIPYDENLNLVLVEYVMLGCFMGYELIFKTKTISS
jgi:alpha-1,6-mannosyltransferase